jgi:glycosyltransferase involved in cell wall biosynthesis
VRVALVHDWLTGMRGGERVLHEVVGLYPDADLFTLVHVPGSANDAIERRRVESSFLSRLPGTSRHYRKWLPLFPWAVRRLRLDGYDLVLSTSHAFAKSVRRPPAATHVSYCFTPMRYVWDQVDAYLGRGPRRALAAPLVAGLRRFDRRTAGPATVTRFVACSSSVAERIRRHYRRDAAVVFPPVDLERFRPSEKPPEDYYLLVGAFVPYKAEAVALQAFARLGRRLLVVGDGPGRKRLERRAPACVQFTGRVSDAELASLYAGARALVHPQEEDFGICALEAQAAGRPVIALGRGGALDTVVPRRDDAGAPNRATGVFFHEQTPAALAEAVERFEKLEERFDARSIRSWAEGFGPARFRRALGAQVERALAEGPEERRP